MSDPNMITAYSWAAGLFRLDPPSSLIDVEKRAKLVNEINEPLIIRGGGKSYSSESDTTTILKDLDDNEKNLRLDDIAQISMSYITEELHDSTRKNILLCLWVGCIDAAKAIRFTYVSGIKDGIVIEAPITIEYRQRLFALIDLLSKTDLIYKAGVEAAPVYKKIVQQHYSSNGVPMDSAVRKYPNEYRNDL
jgi:hypothetical protein